MKDITLEDIKKAEENLSPCPFCGVKPKILVCDDEGNIKRDPEEYLKEQWSGLSFALSHPEDKSHAPCPITTEEDEILGVHLYDTPDLLVEIWNMRFNPADLWFGDVSEIYLRLKKGGKRISMKHMFISSRLSYLKNVRFNEAIEGMREEWKNGYEIIVVFEGGEEVSYYI